VKTFWIVVSTICGVAALVLGFRNEFEKAFVVGAVGAVAWFLSYRVQVKEKLAQRDKETEPIEEVDSDEK
jgi:hypothetical protein